MSILEEQVRNLLVYMNMHSPDGVVYRLHNAIVWQAPRAHVWLAGRRR